MANENFKTLETIDGIEYVFNYKKFRDEIRRISRLMKQKGSVSSVEEYREVFAEKIMVSVSALKQWETGRNGVSDLERVKEIAMHLYLPDYRKLLMPKSEPVEKENSVMMNRVIDEKEREVARRVFERMVDYIRLFCDTEGFADFSHNLLCKDGMDYYYYAEELQVEIDKMRFDLPQDIYFAIVRLYREIEATGGDDLDFDWSIYDGEEYKSFVRDTFIGDVADTSFVKGAFLERKYEEYYENLCVIMKDYLK